MQLVMAIHVLSKKPNSEEFVMWHPSCIFVIFYKTAHKPTVFRYPTVTHRAITMHIQQRVNCQVWHCYISSWMALNAVFYFTLANCSRGIMSQAHLLKFP